MAIASASEWLPVTTSWWFNEFITEFQRKTTEWMSYCSTLQVPKSIMGEPFLSVQHQNGNACIMLRAVIQAAWGLRGGCTKGRESRTESAATWSVEASVPVIPGVWKNYLSLRSKLVLSKPDEINDHRNLAQGFRCIPSSIPSPLEKKPRKEKQTLNSNSVQTEAKEESMSAYFYSTI